LVYGREAVVPTDFINPSLCIAHVTHMIDDESFPKWVIELLALDEAQFLVDFHQTVEEAKQKAWHDKNIKTKYFTQGDQVFLYHSKYHKHLGKLQMHCLGIFVVV
jgi:hypothetical protein